MKQVARTYVFDTYFVEGGKIASYRNILTGTVCETVELVAISSVLGESGSMDGFLNFDFPLNISVRQGHPNYKVL